MGGGRSRTKNASAQPVSGTGEPKAVWRVQ
jgi:hypothetical protein